jgi:hypothetical protein
MAPDRHATDTIDYVVTDRFGLTLTPTRTIIIEAATNMATASSIANEITGAPLYLELDTTYMCIGRQGFPKGFVVITLTTVAAATR